MRVSVLLLIAALAAAPVARAGDVPLGQIFTLAPGEMIEVGDLPLSVQFDEVIADSRCPTGVVCVWEGQATIQLTLDAPGSDEMIVDLHTAGSPMGPNEVKFERHLVRFLEIRPYPDIHAPIAPEDYRVDLIAEPATAAPITSTTWSTVKSVYR